MSIRTLVVMGASAGGVEALTQVVSALPADFESPVCVVLHTPPGSPSRLPVILERSGSLPAEHARDGQRLEAGRILVAPPDRHLAINDGRVEVSIGPRENGHRPAIDTLFRSAAAAHGSKTIGVILSGARQDGAAGLEAIKRTGGIAVIQDPDDALFPEMPLSAAARVEVDHAVPANAIGSLIAELVAARSVKGGSSVPSMEDETVSTEDPTSPEGADPYRDPRGAPSHFSCPECGGVLWKTDGPSDADYRCRVGHAYSFHALEEAQEDGVEAALWMALRVLEENALAVRRLASAAESAGRTSAAQQFTARQKQVERQAAIIRDALAEQARSE